MVLDSVDPLLFSIPAMKEGNGGQMKGNKGHSDIHNALGLDNIFSLLLFDFSQSPLNIWPELSWSIPNWHFVILLANPPYLINWSKELAN